MDLAPRTPSDLVELGSSIFACRALLAANRLGVFAALAEGPLAAVPLARRLGTDPEATRLLLDALAGLALVVPSPEGYRNAPLAEQCLVPGAPEPRHEILELYAGLWEPIGRLEETVRTGGPARDTRMFEEPEALAPGEPDKETFIRAMDDTARENVSHVLAALDLERATTFLDLGAGPGTYALALAERWPRLAVTLFDLPGTLAVTRRIVRERVAERASRLSLVAGDFTRDPLGGPYGGALASHILHGLDEEAVRALVARLAGALAPGAPLLLQDFFLEPDRARPAYGSQFALFMRATNPGARCYSFEETAGWLEAAGFRSATWIRGAQARGISLVRAVRR